MQNKKDQGAVDLRESITLQDVLYWIMDNSDDEEAMNKVNRASFVFTSKYKDYNDR